MMFAIFLAVSRAVSCPSTKEWGDLTSATMHTVDPACFAAMTTADAAAVPFGACAGLTGAQTPRIGETSVLNAFSPACVEKWPVAALAALSSKMFVALTTDLRAVLSAAQLGGMPTTFFSAAGQTMAGYRHCEALSALQVADMGTKAANCAGFTKACVEGIPAAAFVGLSAQCMDTLSDEGWMGMTGEQFGRIQAQTFGALTAAPFLGSVCGGARWEQFSFLTGKACASFEVDCLRTAVPVAFKAVSLACVAAWPKEVLEKLTDTTVAQLPAKALHGLDFGALNPLACRGFTMGQTAWWTNETCAVESKCVDNWADAVLANLPEDCMRGLTQVGGLADHQVAALSSGPHFDGINAKALGAMPHCAFLSSAQLGKLGKVVDKTNQCADLRATCLKNATAVVADLPGACLSAVKSEVLASLPLATFGQLNKAWVTVDTLDALLATHKHEFVDESPKLRLDGVPVDEMSLFHNSIIRNTSEYWYNKTIDFRKLNTTAYIDTDIKLTYGHAIRTMFATDQGLGGLTAADFAANDSTLIGLMGLVAYGVDAAALAGLNNRTKPIPVPELEFVSGLTSEQLVRLNCDVFEAWGPVLTALSDEALDGVTDEQFECAAKNNDTHWPCEFVTRLSLDTYKKLILKSPRVKACDPPPARNQWFVMLIIAAVLIPALAIFMYVLRQRVVRENRQGFEVL